MEIQLNMRDFIALEGIKTMKPREVLALLDNVERWEKDGVLDAWKLEMEEREKEDGPKG